VDETGDELPSESVRSDILWLAVVIKSTRSLYSLFGGRSFVASIMKNSVLLLSINATLFVLITDPSEKY